VAIFPTHNRKRCASRDGQTAGNWRLILFATADLMDRSHRTRGAQISKTATVTALVVLGAHRSGTSSVAGALVQLGGDPPAHPMPSAQFNERGFIESTVVTDLNDEVLRAAGTRWDDWRAFDRDAIGATAEMALRARAAEALAGEFSDARLPVLKDPRMCRLMGFWRPVFDDAGWSMRAVLPIRSPLEVARSLEQRDAIHPSVGCLLWLRHVFDAEAETRGAPRAFVDWSAFLSDRAATLHRVGRLLDITLPQGAGDAHAVEDFVSDALRHFKASPQEMHGNPAISRLACEVYDELLGLAEHPNDAAALHRLDGLRARFDLAADIFGPAMGHLNRKVAVADKAVADIAARFAELRQAHEGFGLKRLFKGRSSLDVVRASAFFDAAHYLVANPDVRDAGCDPAEHYLAAGAREGRDPGPHFSSAGYWSRNPDVAASEMNPLLHYERHGRAEGRSAAG
jgi:hypothetical protein